jgi:hypothetical protein
MLQFHDYKLPIYLNKEESESISAQLSNIIREYNTALNDTDDLKIKEAISKDIKYYYDLKTRFGELTKEHSKYSK